MIEIFIIASLGRKNAENAEMRGRSRGWARVYTALLMFGFEILGALLGFILLIQTNSPFAMYIFALAGFACGGVLSWAIAKRGEPEYQPGGFSAYSYAGAFAPPQPLMAPCKITLIRESSITGMAASYTVKLNGQFVGNLANGSQLVFYTQSRNNQIALEYSLALQGITPFIFDAPDGGHVEVHFKAGRFLPEKTVVIPGAVPPQGYGYAQPMPQYPPQPAPQGYAQPGMAQPSATPYYTDSTPPMSAYPQATPPSPATEPPTQF